MWELGGDVMFACKEHLEHVVKHALSYSNINQVKVRTLDPKIEEQQCEVCDMMACYQIVPIKFE